MVTVNIDETTETGKLRKFSENPIGTPWEKIRERMYDNLSGHYSVNLRTL